MNFVVTDESGSVRCMTNLWPMARLVIEELVSLDHVPKLDIWEDDEGV